MPRTTHSDLSRELHEIARRVDALPEEFRRGFPNLDGNSTDLIRDAANILVRQDDRIGDLNAAMRASIAKLQRIGDMTAGIAVDHPVAAESMRRLHDVAYEAIRAARSAMSLAAIRRDPPIVTRPARVDFDDSPFIRSHMRAPRGRGSWAFATDPNGPACSVYLTPSMTFADARKDAAEHFRKIAPANVREFTLYVLP